jgi:hypothetical protein
VPCLALVALLAACSSSLKLGDRAFTQTNYAAAARTYAKADPADADAVLLRFALLRSVPASPLFDPALAHQVLEELHQKYPASPYGVVAGLLLERAQRQTELEARLHALEEELAQSKATVAKQESDRQAATQAHQAELAKLEEEKQKLVADLKALKDEHAELVMLREEHAGLQQLKADNARILEELEEMKRIDLRR